MQANEGMTVKDVIDILEREKAECISMREHCKKVGNVESMKAFSNDISFIEYLLIKIAGKSIIERG